MTVKPLDIIEHHLKGQAACAAYHVPCVSDRTARGLVKHYRERSAWHRDAVEAIRALEKRIEDLRQASLDVLTARDSHDSPNGHPAHCHRVHGLWGADGSVCQDCLAYDTLAKLVAQP